MSKDNKLVPELRFPEFVNNGEWEHDVVDNLIQIITPPKKLLSDSYLKTGKYPIIDQSKNFYCGWTNDVDAIIKDFLPLIIFGDHTCILKITSVPFAQGADGIKIFNTKNKILPEFLYQFLQYSEVRQEDYKRHFSILKEKKTLFPQKDSGEQQKIAACLSSLDEIISTHCKKLELLKDHKKWLMQNLFPQEGEKVPRYRFKEFEKDGEWQENEIEKIANKMTNKNSDASIKKVFTNSAADGIVDQRDFFDKDIANKSNLEGYFIVEPGDYVYNPRVSNFAPVGPLAKNKTGYTGAVSPLYTVFRFKDKNNDFYEHYFKTSHWIANIKRIANTGARFDRMSISSSQLMSIKVFSPKPTEQQKIASCLSSLDYLITAQGEKIEQLKLHKKGLMQGLFPKMND